MSVEFWALLVTAISGAILAAMLLAQYRAEKTAKRPKAPEVSSADTAATSRQLVLARLSQLLDAAAERDVFQLGMGATVALGFDAATLLDRDADTPIITVGDWRCVAPTKAIRATDTVFEADVSDVVITSWRSESQREIFSVSVVEPTTSLVVVGWSRVPVSDALADDFARAMRLLSDSLSSENVDAEPSLAS